jgi:TfoX/Sxy family transcriptional regulator of competence genes
MAEPYLAKLTEVLSSARLQIGDPIRFQCKHFFSGAALYANGKICASLGPAGFGLKLPATLRAELLVAGEGSEFRFFADGPAKTEYLAIRESVLADPDALRQLLAASAHYAANVAAPDAPTRVT